MVEKDGRYIFGIVKVGTKGQIVIPNDARKVFDIKTGDSLMVLGDERQGIALVKGEEIIKFAHEILTTEGNKHEHN